MRQTFFGKESLTNKKHLSILIIFVNAFYFKEYLFREKVNQNLLLVGRKYNMITYNELYDALRKERYSEQLQPMAKNFIKEVSAYLKDKKELAEKKDEDFSEAVLKTKKQFENSLAIFKELILRRKKKILDLAFVAAETGISKRDFENMLAVEKECFEGIMKSLEKGDKKIGEMLKGAEEEKNKNKMIVFIENTDEFL